MPYFHIFYTFLELLKEQDTTKIKFINSMIVTDLKEKYLTYENMAIWEIDSLETFFRSHEMLYEIFEKEYKFSFSNRNDAENNFIDSDIVVITKLLDYFGDKFFFIFSNNDSNHHILKELQDKKIINFGIDVHIINPNRIFVLEMDKIQDLKMYDTI